MKVLTLSKVFLKGHKRAGQPTHFQDKFLSGEKIHTIRLNEKNYYKDGDMISIRQWTGKPYASKQVEIGQRTIGVESLQLRTDFLAMIAGRFIHPHILAANDGLDLHDLRMWFFPKGVMSNPFFGDIIHFTDFRYRH